MDANETNETNEMIEAVDRAPGIKANGGREFGIRCALCGRRNTRRIGERMYQCQRCGVTSTFSVGGGTFRTVAMPTSVFTR